MTFSNDPSRRARNRRIFMLQIVSGASVFAASRSIAAVGDKPPLTPDEPYPRSMGFKLKTEEVDQAKYPRHTVEQRCSKCQLYSGKEGDPLGPCSFFKRDVPPDGWCRNFKVKKAGVPPGANAG